MADNTVLNSGVGGDTIAADEISGVKYQRVKVNFGANNETSDVGPLNPLPTVNAGAGTIVSASKAVTTAGTRVQVIVASTPCKVVWVAADLGNTDIIVIGSNNVVAALSSQVGIPLVPGNTPIPIHVNDVNLLWIDSVVSGEKLTYAYTN